MVALTLAIQCSVLSVSSVTLPGQPEKIVSVRVVGNAAVTIKPCEPVFVLLDVSVATAGDSVSWRRIASSLTHSVWIDEDEYGTKPFGLPDSNEVVAFEWDPSVSEKVIGTTRTRRVMAILYINFKERRFLFRAPGAYSVRFPPDAQVTVTVETPTEAEKALIDKMETMGLQLPVFLMQPTDPPRDLDLAVVDGLLRDFGDTDHAGLLAACLAIAKSQSVELRPGMSWDKYTDEKYTFLRSAERYMRGPIRNPQVALWVLRLGTIELQRSEKLKEKDISQASALREKAVARLKEVAQSSLALGSRASAEVQLAKLRAQPK